MQSKEEQKTQITFPNLINFNWKRCQRSVHSVQRDIFPVWHVCCFFFLSFVLAKLLQSKCDFCLHFQISLRQFGLSMFLSSASSNYSLVIFNKPLTIRPNSHLSSIEKYTLVHYIHVRWQLRWMRKKYKFRICMAIKKTKKKLRVRDVIS